MKTITHKPLTIALLIAIFAVSVLFAPSSAEARWKDNSDDLPGMDFSITPYLIAAGVLVGGFVVYKLAKPGSKAPDKEAVTAVEAETVDDEATDEKEAAVDDDSGPEIGSILIPEEDSRLGMFFNVTDDRAQYRAFEKPLDLSDMTVRAGVTIGF